MNCNLEVVLWEWEGGKADQVKWRRLSPGVQEQGGGGAAAGECVRPCARKEVPRKVEMVICNRARERG